MPNTVHAQRRRVELIAVPLMATLCMVFIIGAVVLDNNAGGCPPSHWDNRVSLTLTGSPDAISKVTQLSACIGSSCGDAKVAASSQSPTSQGQTSQGHALQGQASAVPTAAAVPAQSVQLQHQSDGTWLYSAGSVSPGTVTFRAIDASGNVRAEQTYTLNWTRVGGNDLCSGPMAPLTIKSLQVK